MKEHSGHPLTMAHDEGARLRIESLEKFIAKFLLNDEKLYYCGVHHVHYIRGDDKGSSQFPASYCPKADDDPLSCVVWDTDY